MIKCSYLRYIITLISFWAGLSLYAQKSCDSLFTILDREIELAPTYIDERVKLIEALKSGSSSRLISEEYSLYRQIYNLYRSFQADSAYRYAVKCYDIAKELDQNNIVVEARSQILFSLLSSGYFKEGVEIIETTNCEGTDSLIRAEFYGYAARLYSDLSYDRKLEPFSTRYSEQSAAYCDSAMALLSPDSYEYLAMEALQAADTSLESRIDNFNKLLALSGCKEHNFAINSANLANLHLMQGDSLRAMEYWIESAIVDTRLSIMETTAKRDLAKLLYWQGDSKRAIHYIHSALEEAGYYNAKQRLLQINDILPIIERSHHSTITRQNESLSIYLLFVVLLVVLLIIFSYALHRKSRTIKLSNETLEQKSCQLEQMNSLLSQMNRQLLEKDKIKDIYIWESLNSNSQYISNMESTLDRITNRLRQQNQIQLLRGIGIQTIIKRERQELLGSFDRALLLLFPNFIDQYYSLFDLVDMVGDDNRSLNSEMRIVAIIRLGITDSEKISQLLNLSVNTIYSYKTRIKSRCTIKDEELESVITRVIR